MSERLRIRMLWLAAVASLVCGALLTLTSVRNLRAAEDRSRSTRSHVEQLEAHEARFNRSLDARQAFEKLSSKKPVPLDALLAKAFPGKTPQDVRESYREIGEGWGVRRREFSLAEVPFAGVMAFLREAENRRPPWRVLKCDIRASTRPGEGKVDLALEALEKAE
jgi:hypothetical protein